ncbi:MAG TPA: hypothetical protein VL402_09090 [Xanthobacteraceae bacterium]|nr:hypothetical protein [Xanthobacteraceae bacterium]
MMRDRFEAFEKQRREQQGEGRPIQSFLQPDGRVVVVGKRLFKSPSKTFHDFLLHYVGLTLGKKWFSTQMAASAPHPAGDWANALNAERRDPNRGVRKASNGARSLLALAYNLYLIEHHYKQYHQPLLDRLLRRLREKDNFFPTLSETYASAAFLKAGFHLEYEDDRAAGEHAEFVATHPRTGRKFSVEVKTRAGPDRQSEGTALRLKVTKKLQRALAKNLPHDRVVWIDLNIPDETPAEGGGWMGEVINEIDRAESEMMIDGKPAPPAYLFVTNQPYHYNPNAILGAPVIGALGFKISNFQRRGLVSFRDSVMSRRAHPEMHEFLDSLRTHTEPPITFDGQAPEIAFGDTKEAPLLIGNVYLIPGKNGVEISAILESATMMEHEKRAYGVYHTTDNKRVIVTTLMTDDEIAAWRRHPETFFGKIQSITGKVDNVLDLAHFMYQTYRNTSKETLLTWMKDHPQIDDFRLMSQDELAILYCDMCSGSLQPQAQVSQPTS